MGRAMAARVLGAIGFRWSCFALMTVMAVWNESRPGTKIHDPLLEQIPYIAWFDHWNYWIWLAAWILPSLAFLFVNPARFVRFMVSGGLLSLCRGICVVATCLGPVRGPDVNLVLAWDWPLRLEVVTRILNPLAVLNDGAAHIWLTKDLFFSGHAASCALLLLYVWPHRGLRFVVLALNVPVTLSLFCGHVHYTIDVIGAWILVYLCFAWRERCWHPALPRYN